MPLLEVQNLKTYFTVRRGGWLESRQVVKAVDDVSLTVGAGETIGLVGESGCGKSTLARSLIHVDPPTAGKILFDGEDVSRPDRGQLQRLRGGMQMVFQDPYGSLNPRLRAGEMLAEVLKVHTRLKRREREKRVAELMELVGLSATYVRRFPHEFSGGQRQRLGIARALAVNPRLILADEPVSALDVSVQAQIINLLQDVQEQLGLSYLFVAHDLAVVEHISHRVAVMYLGKIVETAGVEELFANARHPYTQALFAAIPTLEPGTRRQRLLLPGDVPSPMSPPPGCAFHPRCPRAVKRCAQERPELQPLPQCSDHRVACHLAHD